MFLMVLVDVNEVWEGPSETTLFCYTGSDSKWCDKQ